MRPLQLTWSLTLDKQSLPRARLMAAGDETGFTQPSYFQGGVRHKGYSFYCSCPHRTSDRSYKSFLPRTMRGDWLKADPAASTSEAPEVRDAGTIHVFLH